MWGVSWYNFFWGLIDRSVQTCLWVKWNSFNRYTLFQKMILIIGITHTHTHTHTRIYIYIYIYIYVCVCVCVCVHARLCKCARVCVRVSKIWISKNIFSFIINKNTLSWWKTTYSYINFQPLVSQILKFVPFPLFWTIDSFFWDCHNRLDRFLLKLAHSVSKIISVKGQNGGVRPARRAFFGRKQLWTRREEIPGTGLFNVFFT